MKTFIKLVTTCLFLIVAKAQAQTSWIGAGTNWGAATNWTAGVPSAAVEAIIGDANFTGPNQPTVTAASTAKSLNIGTNGGTMTLTLLKTLTVSGNIVIGATGKIVHNTTSALALTGNWTNSGIYTNLSTGSVTFSGAAGTVQTLNGATTFKTLTVGGAATLLLNANIVVNTTFKSNGKVDPNESPTYTITGTANLTTGAATVLFVKAPTFSGNYAWSGTYVLNGRATVNYASTNSNQTIATNLIYGTLAASGGTMKTPEGNLLITNNPTSGGNITVTNATLDLAGFTANRTAGGTAGGTVSVAAGGNLRIGGVTGMPANFKTYTINAASTVEYYGGSQTISNATYGNLILSSSNGVATKTLVIGALTIAGNLTAQAGSGTGVSFAAVTNINVTGSVNIASGSTYDGGPFTNSVTGSWTNNGTFTGNVGTVIFKGTSVNITGSGANNFFNLTVTGAGVAMASNTVASIGGNLLTSGSGTFTHTPGGTGTITMSGALKAINGTGIAFNNLSVSGNVTNNSTLTIAKNLAVSGTFTGSAGTITLSGTGATFTGGGTTTFKGLTVSGTVTATNDFTISGSTMTVGGSFTSTAGTATFTGTSVLSGTANLFNTTINGTKLQLGASAFLGVASTMTLTAGTLDVTTTIPNTVNYNGSGSQSVLATTYYNLGFGGGTKTAAGALTVTNDITINNGATFVAGNFTHSIYGDWNNNGSFTAGASTIQFLGFDDAAINGATTFNALTENKENSNNVITLATNISVGTLNMSLGQMLTGPNTLTITVTRNGGGTILGTITRTHAFFLGTVYAFEGTNNTITFTSLPGSISSVTVGVGSGVVSDFPFGGSINRVYTNSITGTGGYIATLRLHYLDSELNGNVESSMQLWRYGTPWAVSGKSGNDTVNNYVENVLLTDVSGRWTLSDDASVARWNGSVSSAWETAANWTAASGSPSLPPSATDSVEIGTVAFTNQPTINSAVSVKSVSFGSVSTQAVTLTIASGNSLTTAGNISGTWTTNATHTINLGSSALNVGGNLVLSDGTTGHAINLSASTGTVTVSGSLTESGGANVSFTGAGTLNLAGDFVYSSGTFTAGGSTVNYNGGGSQAVAGGLAYNSLSLAKSGGTATLGGATTVNSNLTMTTGGTFLLANNLTVAGNVSIGAGATLNGSANTLTVGGSWTNSGAFTPGTSTVIFNGAGNQFVPGITFNNLTINKTSGTASLSGVATVGGNLALNAGTLDLGAFSANRSAAGGTLTLGANTVMNVAGAFPSNYTTRNLAASSLVFYNGSSAQTVSAETYGNLSLTNSGAKTLSGATTVAGDFLISTGATLDASAFSLTAQGNWTNNGTFTPSASSVTLAGTGKNITGINTFSNLTVNGSYTAATNITVNGAMVNAGTWITDAATNTFAGDFSNTGTLTSSGTIIFSGTVAQTIAFSSDFTSSGTVNFNGAITPVLAGTTAPVLQNVIVNNTGGLTPNLGWAVNGNFVIGSGVTFSAGSGNYVFDGSFTNSGTYTSAGTTIFNPSSAANCVLRGTAFTSTGTTIFGGSGAITISGGVPTFAVINITNNNAAGITPAGNWTTTDDFVIAAGATFNGGAALTHTIGGDWGNNGTFAAGTSTISFNSATAIGGSATTTFNNFTVTAAGAVTNGVPFNVSGNFTNNGTFNTLDVRLTFNGSSSARITGTATTTFDDMLISKSGAAVTLGVNLTSNTGDLEIFSGTFDESTFTITTTGTTALTVDAGGTLRIAGANTLPAYTTDSFDPASTVEYYGAATQTIAPQNYGNLTSSSTGARVLPSTGTVGIAGTFTPGSNSYTTNGSTVNFNGAGAQTIPAFGYNNLSSSSTGARTLAPSGIINVSGIFTPGANTYTVTGSTVRFNGATQSIPAFTYNNLTANNSATATLAGNVTVNGALAVSGTLADGGFIATIKGDSANTGTLTGTGKLVFNGGTTNHVLSGGGAYNNIELNDANGAILSQTNLNVKGTLTLNTGTILTTTNKVIATNGVIVRANGYVVGNLQKNVTNGVGSVQTFEIGTTNGYNPVSLTFSNVTATGNLTATVTNSDHPSIASATIKSNITANDYWTLSKDATLAFNAFNATFNFNNPGDLDAGADPTTFKVGRFASAAWTYPTLGAATTTNTIAIGVPGLGDFQLGANLNSAPTISAISTLSGGLEDTGYTITYAALLAASDAADVDNDVLAFRIESVTSGTLTKSNVAVTAGTTLLSTNESLVWTPATNVNGAALSAFVVRVSDGSSLSTGTAQVKVAVTAINDAPSFTKGADATVLEDAGATAISGWATSTSAGPADESGQVVTFVLSNDNNALFSTQPAVSTGGILTFTPAANANGLATVTIFAQDNGGTANGGVNTSASQTFVINVTPVNDVPSFTKGTNVTVLEDSGTFSATGWATSISVGPANESTQTLAFTVANNNNGLFSTQPAVASDGTLTFTPAANSNGTATVTIFAQDNGGTANGGVDTSASQTFTVTVTAVNDAPSFVKGSDITVFEDAGAQTNIGWATSISAGPSNESTQALNFIVSNDNNALFSVQPAISTNGTLIFTTATNANGSSTVTVALHDNGGTANSGVDTSASQTFAITVNGVNDAPSFTKGTNVTVLEDSGAFTSTGWATSILAGPANESTQAVSFVVVNNNNGLFAVQPAVSTNGTLTFTPAGDSNGTATVTIFAQDNGGTANSGIDSSASQTFVINVTPVNDAPSFVKGADVTVLEDSGAYTGTGWATSISAGPPNESTQSVSFVVANNNTLLFTAQPAVSTNGTLTFTPAANGNGSATVTIFARDNGGTNNGGIDTSASQTFVINVTPVNDAPSFTKGPDVTVAENSTAYSAAWATGINVGPANESTQTLAFVVANNNNGLFSVQPSISTSGTLTFTPATSSNGTATVTVYVQDNGGTANGGVDTSATQTFVINMSSINDAPSFAVGSDVTVLEDSGAFTTNGWATSISAGPPNEANQSLNFIIVNNNTTLFSAQPSVSTNGTLTFTPAANANGTATVTISLHDDGGTANGGIDTSAMQTFVINVTSVNDAPTFLKGADVTVAEDASAYAATNWATGISAGAMNESTQSLTFVVANDNPTLFSVPPAVSTNGTLTFTAASSSNGTANVTIYLQDNGGTANGGADTSATQTFVINVLSVNDAPSFVKGADVTLLEDAGAYTAAGWATSISAGPANESTQALNFIVTNNNATMFSVQPALSTNGTLTFTPAANSNGTATVTVSLHDDGGSNNGGIDTSATQTFVITITPVNDAPGFTKGADVTLLEDSGIYTAANWATNISAGPSNESTQALTFVLANNNNQLFAVQPALSTNGILTFTPAANSNGTATVTVYLQDNGGTANGGLDTSSTQTFIVTVTSVNDAPSFTKGADVSILENSTAYSAAWATAISAGPNDESTQALNFIVSNNNNSLFSAQPAVSTNGTLTFTPAANMFGSATVTVSLHDDGGTANGGADTSASQTFVISVSSVNNPPTLDPITNLITLEDSGLQTVTLTGITAGPTNEIGQNITIRATSDNTALIPNPGVSYSSPNTTGTLTFTPGSDQIGTATITVVVSDNGSTNNGGINAVTNTFTVTVNPVNHAPSFLAGTNAFVTVTNVAQTFSNWATAISPGLPANESTQSVTFLVSINFVTDAHRVPQGASSYLFTTLPAIDSNGTLTFTPNGNSGLANVSVRLMDNGGTNNGGIDTSAAQTFNIGVGVTGLTPATGGEAISVDDKATGNWTILSGPSYYEGESGAITLGTLQLTLPPGFEFDTNTIYNGTNSQAEVVLTDTLNSGGDNVNGATNGQVLPLTMTSTTATFTVTSVSTNGAVDTIMARNFRVRPTTTNLVSGYIYFTGTSSTNLLTSGPTGTDFGNLATVPGAPYQLSYLTQPSSNAVAGVAFVQQPVVIVQDQFLHTVTNASTNSITLTRFPAGANNERLRGDTNAIVIAGVADFAGHGLFFRTNGVSQILATSTGLISAVSSNVVVTTGPGVALAILTQPSATASAGIAFPQQPVVTVQDAFGNTVISDNSTVITATRNLSTGTTNLAGTTNITVVNGIATFGNLSYAALETISIDFNSGSLTPVTSSNVTVSAGAAVRLVFTQQPGNSTNGNSLTPQPVVKVLDAFGNLTTNVASTLPVTLSLLSGTGLSGNTNEDIGSSAGAGTAAFSNLSITGTGSKQLVARAAGLISTTSSVFTISASLSILQPHTDYSVGHGPYGMYLGNLRGNGNFRDMEVANYLDNTVTVRLCNDDGTFAAATNYPVGLNPAGIYSGYFFHSSSEDIVVANSGTNTITMLLNLGKGTFWSPTSYRVGSTPNPGPVALIGGYIRTSRPDLIVANQNENTVSVLFNTNGVFSAPMNYPVGNGPSSVMVADLTGDGILDILTANKNDNTLSILPGLGGGFFGTAITIHLPGNPQPSYALVGDFNNDKRIDIAVANYNSNSISILLAQPDHSFVLSTNYAVGAQPMSLLVRDLDEDGYVDFVTANSGDNSLTVLRNQRDGTFSTTGTFGVRAKPITVVGSNFNGDQATDLAVTCYNDNVVSVLINAVPLAYAVAVTVPENIPTTVKLSGKLQGPGSLNYIIVDQPAHGTLSGPTTNLVYTPNLNYIGTDTFHFAAGNGTTYSTPGTVTLTILPVNQAPTFNLLGNVTLPTDSALTNIVGYAYNISPGSPNETTQKVTFVVATTNKTLFTNQPAITTNGTLTFRPAAGKIGTAIVTVYATDNGGTAVGGTNRSTTQTFTITVTANPMRTRLGVYNGLFYNSTQVGQASSGYFSATISGIGTYSAKIICEGKTNTFSGRFDFNGMVQTNIIRTNKATIAISMLCDANDEITGTLTTTNWTASLTADRQVFNTTNNPTARAGKYTFVLPILGGTSTNAEGYGLATITTAGVITASGTLSDGTTFSQSTTISKDGLWPMYFPVYAGAGSVISWVNVTNRVATSMEGTAVWLRTNSFTNAITVSGSTYVPPTTGHRALNVTNATVQLGGFNLLSPIQNNIVWNTNNTITVVGGTNHLALTVTATNGYMSGTFLDPVTHKSTAIKGVILQQSTEAGGFNLLGTQSGGFRLNP